MKTTVLLFIALILFFSCKRSDVKNAENINSQLTASVSGLNPVSIEKALDNKGSDDENNFILANSTLPAWTPEEKTTFMMACEEGTAERMGAEQSTNYCACLLNKLEKLYPIADDVINLPDKKQQELSNECMK